MPIHDWTRVRANRFHDFRQGWTVGIAGVLNGGLLSNGYFALIEQTTAGPRPQLVAQAEATIYARKANRVTVRHPDGQVVAVIEVVSPGNKDSQHAIKSFVRKAVEFVHAGVHLLIVDLFPPSKRDPQGIHPLIWGRIRDEEFALPPGQPLTLAAYSAGGTLTGYVEPIGVGEAMPDMPIFLTADRYVPCPLEATYQASWDVFPLPLRGPLVAT